MLLRYDTIERAPNFEDAARELELRPWQWDVVLAADGIANLGTLATRLGIDFDVLSTFAEESHSLGLTRIVQVSLERYRSMRETSPGGGAQGSNVIGAPRAANDDLVEENVPPAIRKTLSVSFDSFNSLMSSWELPPQNDADPTTDSSSHDSSVVESQAHESAAPLESADDRQPSHEPDDRSSRAATTTVPPEEPETTGNHHEPVAEQPAAIPGGFAEPVASDATTAEPHHAESATHEPHVDHQNVGDEIREEPEPTTVHAEFSTATVSSPPVTHWESTPTESNVEAQPDFGHAPSANGVADDHDRSRDGTVSFSLAAAPPPTPIDEVSSTTFEPAHETLEPAHETLEPLPIADAPDPEERDARVSHGETAPNMFHAVDADATVPAARLHEDGGVDRGHDVEPVRTYSADGFLLDAHAPTAGPTANPPGADHSAAPDEKSGDLTGILLRAFGLRK